MVIRIWGKNVKLRTNIRLIISLLFLLSSSNIIAGIMKCGNAEGDSTFSNIDIKIDRIIKNGNLPSTQIAIVEGEKVIWSKFYDNSNNEKVLYKIGSIEKVLTATAYLQLHEKKVININDDVNKYLPFSLRHPKYPDVPITIKMLLSNRSGLEMFKNQFDWDTKDIDLIKKDVTWLREIKNWNKEQFIRASLDTGNINYSKSSWNFKPGTNYIYSNSGFFILSYLLENITGQTYAKYIIENIFKPLNMNDSRFVEIDSSSSRFVAYTRNGKQNIKLQSMSGMYTTANDMAKFMIAHMNMGNYNGFTLLSPKTIELMYAKHTHGKNLFHLIDNCPFDGYGLGIIHYDEDIYGHGGSTIGYQSLWSFNRSSKKGYIILTNINGLVYGSSNFNSIWNSVSAIEELLKSELGFTRSRWIIYYLIGSFILISFLVIFIMKKRKRAFNTT